MGIGAERRVVFRWAGSGDGSAAAAAEVLLSESRKPLLLGDSVDVGADNECDEVEEGNPEVVGEELLRESKADGRGNPANLHDLPESHTNSGLDLVKGLRASNQGHGNEVNAVLDRRNLWGGK